jgi:hypothetical protein
VLQYHFNWKVLSVAAGMTWWNFYFRLYPGTIRSAQVVDFLGHLLRHVPGKLLVLWDRLSQHKARLTQAFIGAQHGRIVTEYLPTYAPELTRSNTFGVTGKSMNCLTSGLRDHRQVVLIVQKLNAFVASHAEPARELEAREITHSRIFAIA